MLKNITQTYWKSYRSLLISFLHLQKPYSKLLIYKIFYLKIYLTITLNKKEKNLKLFWIFFYLFNQKPVVYLKKTHKQNIWNTVSLNLTFNSKNSLSMLNKLLINLIPNTNTQNIKTKIYTTYSFMRILSISGYLETDNMFYTNKVFEGFSLNMLMKTNVQKQQNTLFLKFLQIPNNFLLV